MSKSSIRLQLRAAFLLLPLFAIAPPALAATKFEMPRTCEGLFLSGSDTGEAHTVPAIIAGLQKTGVTGALDAKECAAFTGACALASVTVGVEALGQFNGADAAPRAILKSEAQRMVELLATVTKRKGAGLSIGETIGVLRFALAQRGQDAKTSIQFTLADHVSDLALGPNEMMIIAGDAGFGKHMILAFEQRAELVRAVDPQTGKIEEFHFTTTPWGAVRLVNMRSVGITSTIDVIGLIRVTPEASGPRTPSKTNELRGQTEAILRQVRTLRSVVEDFYSLLPGTPKSPFKTIEESRVFVKSMLDNFNLAKNVLKKDVLSYEDMQNAGLVFELQLTVADVLRRAEENGFFGWLEHHKLTGSTAKPVALPKWDVKMLEARVSPAFKEKRAAQTAKLDALMQKVLNPRDIEFGIHNAVQAYFDLVLEVAREVQPVDAHRLMTPYFERLEFFMQSPQLRAARESSSMIIELSDSQMHMIRSARKSLGVDQP